MVTENLGFDAALLLLLEDTLYPATRVIVRAFAASSPSVVTWHLYGERLSHCTLLLDKEVEVDIGEHPTAVSPQVQRWLQDQYVTTTLFVPLVCQGKTLGSLGFSRSKGQTYTFT